MENRMLEPIGPSYQPDKPSSQKDEKPIAQTSESNDSEGYRFNFFSRMSQKQKEDKGKDKKKQYCEDQAVDLKLSPEAIEKMKKQRNLKENKNKVSKK